PNETDSALFTLVPSNAQLPEIGDIVEVRSGRQPSDGDVGALNTVTRVVQRGPGECRWDPPKDYLWRRILYCDWMASQGWTLHSENLGLTKYWIKELGNGSNG